MMKNLHEIMLFIDERNIWGSKKREI